MHAIQAAIAWGAMVVLVRGRYVNRCLVQSGRRGRRNAGLLYCGSRRGRTSNGAARDQEDHGQQ